MNTRLMLALAFAFACAKAEPGAVGPTPIEPAVVAPKTPVPGELVPGVVTPIETPAPEKDPMERGRRRLDLDQLEQAIFDATGVRWTIQRNGSEVRRFEELAETLGKPDYANTTNEDLSPSIMFQRFLDDAARDVCRTLLENERTASPRRFFIHADRNDRSGPRIEQNLGALLLRFHGRTYAAGSDGLRAWTGLFTEAEAEVGDPEIAWTTVCVGLLTHPDFYTF